jgi:hypothetical protein
MIGEYNDKKSIACHPWLVTRFGKCLMNFLNEKAAYCHGYIDNRRFNSPDIWINFKTSPTLPIR